MLVRVSTKARAPNVVRARPSAPRSQRQYRPKHMANVDFSQRRYYAASNTEMLSQKLKELSDKLNITKLEDWYSVDAEALTKAGGEDIVKHYGTVAKALVELKPEHRWTPWMFKDYEKTPRNFWGDPKNQREYLNWLGQHLGYKTMEDWYNITREDIKQNHGAGLLALYSDSPTAIVMNILTGYRWLEWRFKQVPQGWWQIPSNQLRFLEYVKEQERFVKMEDFYKLTKDIIVKHGGKTLLNLYNGSPYEILQACYPHYQWLPWLFATSPAGWWDSLANQRMYLDWFRSKHGYDTFEDVYHITADELQKNHGSSLLAKYDDSVSKAIMSVYQEHHWLPWRFVSLNPKWWDTLANRRMYLDWLTETQKLQLESFYSLNPDVIHSNSGTALLNKFGGSVAKLVADVYPTHNWEPDKFHNFVQKQTSVNSTAKAVMAYDVKESVLSELKYRGTNKAMELDVYVKEYNLGFEYQGERHYFDCTVIGERDAFIGRDSEKAVACATHGITLVEVPYWWDSGRASLARVLRTIRADLIPIMRWKEGDP